MKKYEKKTFRGAFKDQLFSQIKSVLRDKFCLMTFFLPVVVAAGLHLAGEIDFSSLEKYHFGVTEGELPAETLDWLARYGTVTVCPDREALIDAVNDPATSLIGVRDGESGIRTLVSGDELSLIRETADTLPALYARRQRAAQTPVKVFERPGRMAGFGDLLLVMTQITAMFMGCTFNAMNIISEKEDGVVFVNGILPMSRGQYLLHKTAVGFACGCLSALLCALICFRLSSEETLLLSGLIVLCAFLAALLGLLIGNASQGMMTGVAWIKVVMLVFIAVPVLGFLAQEAGGALRILLYLVPSHPAFEGIMDLIGEKSGKVYTDMVILALHCGAWLVVCMGRLGKRGARR